MAWCSSISGNGFECLIALAIANQAAQWFKVLRLAYTSKSFNLSMLFASGGMPSSHSSTVTAMATSVGLVSGFDSTLFAIGVCLSIVVMYDAAGVRQAAGRQAKILNQIIQDFFSPDNVVRKEKLKEFLGHTPKQVYAGAALGVAVSFALHYLLKYFGCQ
jgi:uncharacterized protein